MSEAKARVNTHLACEEMDFTWDLPDVMEFDQLWQAGKSIPDIADWFGRDPDEVGLLVIDRARKGFIARRFNGIEGGGFGRKRAVK